MTKLRNSIGERIRAIRKAKGLTQQQLAELSGLDDAYIGSVERGERNFSVDTLEKITIGLKVSVYQLFFDTSNINKEDLDHHNAIAEYTSIISDIKPEQLKILRNIINELKAAFH
ncbi:helix-turn-helix transcriptional regulator [Paenibacillus sp. FSL R5-0749]|uniref:helix-turn-helix domain-containing protein n=1 Tax=Paenibacillus sp. FSL R5-0749 TaxID=2921657 RepID=UPI00315A5B24